MKILAISGSLREASTNTTVLKSLRLLASPTVQITLFDGLARLPHFNPDLDIDPAIPEVQYLRDELNASQAVFISTPEYAHGLPGSLKNALDWLVRSGELYAKPLAIINASPRSTFAQASLREILNTMGVRLVPQADLTLSISGAPVNPEAIACNLDCAESLRRALHALSAVIESHL